MTTGRRATILIGLVLALVVSGSGVIRLAPPIPGVPPLVGREILWWGLAALILLYVLVVERRPLSSIGFRRPTWKTLAFGIGGAVLTLASVGLAVQFLIQRYHLTQNAEAMAQIVNLPLLYRVALVTRAAFAEEILFRGYGIERLQELTGSRIVAGLVTLAVFTYAHLSFWGPTQLLFAGGAGLMLTVLYLWRRDLGANILAHWLIDAAGLLFVAAPPHH